MPDFFVVRGLFYSAHANVGMSHETIGIVIEHHQKIPLEMRQTQRNPAVLPNIVVSDIRLS